jgi:hypothetical protein
MVARGDRHRLLADGDCGVQVGQVPTPLEPHLQGVAEVGQEHGAVGVVGRGDRRRLPEQVDSCIERGQVPGA